MGRSSQRCDRDQLGTLLLAAQRNIHAQRITAGIGDDKDNITRTDINLLHKNLAGSFNRFISIVGRFYNFLCRNESACSMGYFHGSR